MASKTKTFVICDVEFEDKITKLILHSSWLIKLDNHKDENTQAYCLWPKNKESAPTLVKNGSSPGKDWVVYKCKVLADYSEYENAQLKLIYLNDSSYSSETKAMSDDTDGARYLEPKSEHQSGSMPSYLTDSSLHEEKNLRAKHQTKHSVDNILDFKQLSLYDRDEEDSKKNYYNFPLKTLADVEEMEEKLKLTSLNHLIIKSHLWKYGPLSNVNDTVPYMLQRLISDECAKNYDFDEENNSKYVFKNLIMCSIVIDVAMSYHENSTIDEIEVQIRNWLRVASMRCKNMGRKLRRKQETRTMYTDS